MLKRILPVLLIAFVLFGTLVAPASSQDRSKEIRAMLEQRDKQIKTMLGNKKTFTEAQKNELKKVINDVIDFQAMSAAALGPHWAKMTPAQRNEFVNVFSEIVRTQSLSNLDIYRTRVTYGKIDVVGDSAHVYTQITLKNVPAKVEYALLQRGTTWRVDDIIVDGVSTTEGYARSFQTVVRKKGFAALMTSLRKKLTQVQAGSAQG